MGIPWCSGNVCAAQLPGPSQAAACARFPPSCCPSRSSPACQPLPPRTQSTGTKVYVLLALCGPVIELSCHLPAGVRAIAPVSQCDRPTACRFELADGGVPKAGRKPCDSLCQEKELSPAAASAKLARRLTFEWNESKVSSEPDVASSQICSRIVSSRCGTMHRSLRWSIWPLADR